MEWPIPDAKGQSRMQANIENSYDIWALKLKHTKYTYAHILFQKYRQTEAINLLP